MCLLIHLFRAHLSRYNVIYTKEQSYWPQETILNCLTARIKRGVILKRQLGVYYQHKSKEHDALMNMDKVGTCMMGDC